MHSSSIHRKPKRLLLTVVASIFLILPLQSKAAQVADDHTVVYYLIEMQRQYTKTCNGVRMADAPSLTPSESVRTLAEMIAVSGQPLAGVLGAHGLEGSPIFYGTTSGSNPNEVAANLISQNCAAIMGPGLRYIGASRNNGIWSVLMTEKEPVFGLPSSPATQQTGMTNASGAVPGTAYPPGQIPQQAVTDGSKTPLTAENQPQAPPVLPQAQPMPGNAQAISGLSPQGAGSDPAQPHISGQAAPIQGGVAGTATGQPAPDRGRVDGATMGQPAPLPAGAISMSEDPNAPAPPQITAIYGPDAHLGPPVTTVSPVATPGTGGTGGAQAVPQIQAQPAPQAQNSLTPAAPVRSQTAPVRVAASPGSAPPAEVLLYLINETRAKGYQCGAVHMPPVPPLRSNPVLLAAAEAHAADMAAKGYFSSASPAGVSLGNRLSNAGYLWSTVGEVIASVQPPANMALETWLHQENQCKLLLSPEYTEAGAAFEPRKNYWVFTLASPMLMEEGGIRLE